MNPSDANYNVPNTVVQSLLGRLPPGGVPNGTTQITLVDNATKIIADNRRTQVDMRFAKIIRLGGGRRADVGVDLQNCSTRITEPFSSPSTIRRAKTAGRGSTRRRSSGLGSCGST